MSRSQRTIVAICYDVTDSAAVIIGSDGRQLRLPLDLDPGAYVTTTLAKAYYFPLAASFLAITIHGDEIAFELPRGDVGDQLAGRPVVYLDQNHWRTIVKAQRGLGLTTREGQSARRIAELVVTGRIVVPISMGHYVETTQWSRQAERYEQGLTMLKLSRGWHMSDPLTLWRDELSRVPHFRHADTDSSGNKPRTAFMPVADIAKGSSASESSEGATPADLPSTWASQYRAVVSGMALINTMLDPEHIPSTRPMKWAAANQRFSALLATIRLDSRQKRWRIDQFLLEDFGACVAAAAARAGLTEFQLDDWRREQAPRDLRHLPAIGLYREMFQSRHLNSGLRWQPNDLNDMMYLSAAAGYADVVVAERHMGAVLAEGARRLERTVRVHHHLQDAIPAIEAALA